MLHRFLAVLCASFAFFLGGSAEGATPSLQICFDDPSVAAGNAVQAFAGSTQIATDIVPGSTTNAGKRCAVVALVASLPRNVDLPVTLRAANALGEVSAASNAVPFRLPSAPTAPTGVTVSIIAGP